MSAHLSQNVCNVWMTRGELLDVARERFGTDTMRTRLQGTPAAPSRAKDNYALSSPDYIVFKAMLCQCGHQISIISPPSGTMRRRQTGAVHSSDHRSRYAIKKSLEFSVGYSPVILAMVY